MNIKKYIIQLLSIILKHTIIIILSNINTLNVLAIIINRYIDKLINLLENI